MNEWLDWQWTLDHRDEILDLLQRHAWLTLVAVAIGTAISLPLAVFAHRHRWFYGPATVVTGTLYTIPSLALFALLFPYTGLGFLTAEIGLVSYTLLILIRNMVAGLQGVPDDALEAARGMGLTDRQILLRVELPLALPVIVAGIRIATVTVIGLVTVTAFVGEGGLGVYILQGLRRFFATPIVIGAILCGALAVAAELILLGTERLLTPWACTRGSKVS